MTSEVNQPISSGQYYVEKFYSDNLQSNTIQAGGPSAPVVMTSAPQYAPVAWTVEKKHEGFYTLMVNKGFASKVGDEKFVFTRPEGSKEIQEWEFRPVLTQGPGVYYIRNRTGHAWTVRGKPDPMKDAQVGLEELGDVWIPEGPPEEFLFTVNPAK